MSKCPKCGDSDAEGPVCSCGQENAFAFQPDEEACPRCKERGKTWNGSDPNCAFRAGIFDTDNWGCATMCALRRIAAERIVWSEDNSVAVMPWDGSFVVLAWYKSRGRTEGAWLCTGTSMLPLTLEMAEEFLSDHAS